MKITFPLAMLAIHANAGVIEDLRRLGWREGIVVAKCKGPRDACIRNYCGINNMMDPPIKEMQKCLDKLADPPTVGPDPSACKEVLECEIDA